MLARTLRTTALPFARRLTQQQPPLLITRFAARAAAASLSTTTKHTAAASHNEHHAPAAGGHDDGHHESHYDAPGGWLFGVPPGEKAESEGWEIPLYGVYIPSCVIAVLIYAMKEDTSIQTWALEEARRRLEKEGMLEDPNP